MVWSIRVRGRGNRRRDSRGGSGRCDVVCYSHLFFSSLGWEKVELYDFECLLSLLYISFQKAPHHESNTVRFSAPFSYSPYLSIGYMNNLYRANKTCTVLGARKSTIEKMTREERRYICTKQTNSKNNKKTKQRDPRNTNEQKKKLQIQIDTATRNIPNLPPL